MDTIIFEISGKFAHFRRFYTNSSSLTYGVPTRTNIVGLVAAILGYNRDSYYENFTRDKLRVAIEKRNKTRKIIQTMNYMRVERDNEFNRLKKHTQVPLEILTAKSEVIYRIYVNHKDSKIMDNLEERILNNQPAYPIYLGIAPFLAKIKYVNRTNLEEFSSKDFQKVQTIVNKNYIEDIKVSETDSYVLVKEKMPVEFQNNRIPKMAEFFIYDENCQPLCIRTNEKLYTDGSNNTLFI